MSIEKETQKVGQVVESLGQAAEQVTANTGKIFKAVWSMWFWAWRPSARYSTA
jgi:hypothetical protein